jgi:hypothetical protein
VAAVLVPAVPVLAAAAASAEIRVVAVASVRVVLVLRNLMQHHLVLRNLIPLSDLRKLDQLQPQLPHRVRIPPILIADDTLADMQAVWAVA